MDNTLPIVYLSTLLVILSLSAIFILRQVLKVRKKEVTLGKLQKKLQNEKGTAQEYYELGSIYLDKKLFVQAVSLLQKALKNNEEIESENQALIYNALGYAYFAQEQYDLAIRYYKDSVKQNPGYVTPWNNLGHVYEKKQLTTKALESYEEVLKYEPENNVAKKRAESLRKRMAPLSSK